MAVGQVRTAVLITRRSFARDNLTPVSLRAASRVFPPRQKHTNTQHGPTNAAAERSLRPSYLILILLGAGVYALSGVGSLAIEHGKLIKQYYKDWRKSVFQPVYQPLDRSDNTRLVILSPGQANDPIQCHLENVSFTGNPKFEALSYAWGEPNPTGEIYCSGKKVHVGYNLYLALKHLRRPDSDRLLWVDALCINQGDAKEKSRQIPQMGKIYSSSEKVLIWLGEASIEIGAAFKTLQEINAYLKKHQAKYSDDDTSLGLRIWLRQTFPTLSSLL